jgi:hypothetical protein
VCICQSVRIHIMHEYGCGLCAQTNTGIDSLHGGEVPASGRTRRLARRSCTRNRSLMFVPLLAGSSTPDAAFCRNCLRTRQVLRKVGRKKPGRTRGGVSGRPDRGPARYRAGALPPAPGAVSIGASGSLRQSGPLFCTLSNTTAVCVRWRTYVNVFCFYIVQPRARAVHGGVDDQAGGAQEIESGHW